MCENPKKTISLWLLAQNPFFFWKSCPLYYWRTLVKQLGDYTVSLSAIEAMQCKYDRKKWAKVSRSENQLRLTLEISEVVNRNWLLFCGSIFVFPLFKVKWTTMLQVWVSSEHCSKIVERYRAVTFENPKKTISLLVIGPEPIFFLIKLSIILLAHLAQATGRLYCELECNRSNAMQTR